MLYNSTYDDYNAYDAYSDDVEDYSEYDFDPCDAYKDLDDYSVYEDNIFISKDECKGEAKFVQTFENGFNIDGEIKTQEELQKLVTEHKRSTRTILKTEELTAGFAALFNDRSSADIILSVNGTPYHTHRFILGLWSPVFSRMLEESERFAPSMTKDEESDCDMIALNESEDDAHVFNKFLKFLYTEQATINIEIFGRCFFGKQINILELFKSCTDFLIQFVHTMALDEELMEILKAAQFWEMHHLQSCVWQIILEKMYFSLEKFLPALEMDQLCEALQSSDLVVENEYRLLLKLTPLLRKLEETEDEASLRKVSSLIRFTEMSATQLHKVAQLDIAEHVRSNITQALLHRCLLWESEEGIDESKGPRCYLTPSPPYFDFRNKFVDTSSHRDNKANWESCRSIKLDGGRLEQSLRYGRGDKCFVYHTESKKQLVISDISISQFSVIARGELIVIQCQSNEYLETLDDSTEAVATVTGVIHNGRRDVIHGVKTTKVPAEVNLHRGYVHLKGTIYLPFKCGISTPYRTLSLFLILRI
ncbi:hypothetical protein BSL78_13937 [Apostichopus japonicus]|uniref:BTB domain-containing protein n=1 Tax=Stichopus japonicus TaxID=307972 RepID=A0A2G8KMK8_STIJA|nr:hypothetical protein BSL78_13937 [Apostichopus japonicus]